MMGVQFDPPPRKPLYIKGFRCFQGKNRGFDFMAPLFRLYGLEPTTFTLKFHIFMFQTVFLSNYQKYGLFFIIQEIARNVSNLRITRTPFCPQDWGTGG